MFTKFLFRIVSSGIVVVVLSVAKVLMDKSVIEFLIYFSSEFSSFVWNSVTNQSTKMSAASFKDYLSTLSIEGEEMKFYDLKKFGDKYYKLPYSIRILLESALRNCDEFQVRNR